MAYDLKKLKMALQQKMSSGLPQMNLAPKQISQLPSINEPKEPKIEQKINEMGSESANFDPQERSYNALRSAVRRRKV